MQLWLVLAAFALAAVTPFIGALPRGGDVCQNAEDARDASAPDDESSKS